jgi:hypothetical protein
MGFSEGKTDARSRWPPDKRLIRGNPAVGGAMNSHQHTGQQLTQIVEEVIVNARQREELYLRRASPLTTAQKEAIRGFFPQRLLDDVNILELKNEHVANPEYQKRAQTRGYRLMLDFRHMPDIAHPRLVIFQEKLSPRLLFHGMVHVMQYAVLGLERYLELYVRAFLHTGNYAAVPLEVQAFQLDRQYTENPSREFSVEAEVRNWAEEGNYEIRRGAKKVEAAEHQRGI